MLVPAQFTCGRPWSALSALYVTNVAVARKRKDARELISRAGLLVPRLHSSEEPGYGQVLVQEIDP